MMTNDELRAMGCTPIEDLIADSLPRPFRPRCRDFHPCRASERGTEVYRHGKDTRQKTCNFTPTDKLK